MKILPIGGKTPNNTAAAVAVDANGKLDTVKTWGNDFVALESGGTNWIGVSTTAKYTDPIDVSDCAMVSLLITSTAKNSNNEAVPITFNMLRTDSDTSTDYMRTFDGNTIVFNVSTAYTLITPDDIPALKYLKYLRFRIIATSAVNSGSVNIKVFKKR